MRELSVLQLLKRQPVLGCCSERAHGRRAELLLEEEQTIAGSKPRAVTGQVPAVRLVHVGPALLQGLADVGLCRLLHWIYRQPLLLPSRPLGADDGYAAREGVQKGGDSVVELAHVDRLLRSCVQMAEQGMYVAARRGIREDVSAQPRSLVVEDNRAWDLRPATARCNPAE